MVITVDYSARRRLFSLTRIIAVASLLSGCINPVGAALYQPQPQPLTGAAPVWKERVPVSVTARTSDGLDLADWFWAPQDASGDVVLFLPGRTEIGRAHV